MRYNPATDRAATLEDLAAQGRSAINTVGVTVPPLIQPRDVFAAESLPIWLLCSRMAARRQDRSRVAHLDGHIARDLKEAMHYRRHQAEF